MNDKDTKNSTDIQTNDHDVYIFPASFAQTRLWLLEQIEPDSAAYNIPGAYIFRGALNLSALDEAVQKIVHRHEVLRTTFSMVAGQPVQIIATKSQINLEIIDYQHYSDSDRDEAVENFLSLESQRLFNLETGPLLRTKLIKLSPDENLFFFNMHHIISDGWSMWIFFRELSKFYAAIDTGLSAHFPDLPIQYADFTIWQRDWLQGEELTKQLTYWVQQLAGVPTLELPLDRPRPAIQTFRGSNLHFNLMSDVTYLNRLAQESGATLFMLLLAAFKVLVYRYTGQVDIAVGTPIANRNQVEIEGLIGFFVNTLVLRTDLSGEITFSELLERVRQVSLDAYTYQDLPFEKLVEDLNPERDLSRNPLFQVLFILQNAPQAKISSLGVEIAPKQIKAQTTHFDLEFHLRENPNGLILTVLYNSDLFDETTITRMGTHYKNVLTAISENPQALISELPILSPQEIKELLEDWNTTEVTYPEMGVQRLFEAQAARTPEAIAAIFPASGEKISYQKLNQKTNQLAHFLRKQGIGPDDLVGIFVDRTIEMVVGILGILKSGAAYVPLDPIYPRDRLEYILTDSQVALVLTQEALISEIPADDIPIVCLDRDCSAISTEPETNLYVSETPENLVYVLYTSGSTGKPKGVAMPHRAMSNLISWELSHSDISGPANTIQFSSLSFDMSFVDMFMSWCFGGTLVVVPGEQRSDIGYLADFIVDHRLERLNLPYVALHYLAVIYNQTKKYPTALKEIFSTAEALQITPAIRNLFSQLPACKLQNQYGPTETHVVTAHKFNEPPQNWPELPTIGTPVANTQIYILDANFQPTPIGVPGDLYIGGENLARGYLHQPNLTAEKFIPNPFCSLPGARLYKTGDLARYLAAGSIEFLGRKDFQVKIRGFRVELGEVETIINQIEGIKSVAVAAKGDSYATLRLVAYLVKDENFDLSTEEIRQYIATHLPDYMIPEFFMDLTTMPLTPTGKVDRQSLPEPVETRPGVQMAYVPPQSPMEQKLAEIWAEVLEIDQVGINDNFFEIGGHSLKAAFIMMKIESEFGKRLPLVTLFKSPTIAGLSQVIPKQVDLISWEPLIPIKATGSKPPFFIVPGVGGNVIGYYDLAENMAGDQPVYGLQSRGLDGKTPPLSSIEEMAAVYILDIQRQFPEGPYFIGGHSFGGWVAYEMACQLHHAGHVVGLVGMIDTGASSLIFLSRTKKLIIKVRSLIQRVVYHSSILLFSSLEEKRLHFQNMQRRYWKRRKYRQDSRQVLNANTQNHPLPPHLQKVKDVNYAVAQLYKLKSYPGKVTVFKAAEQSVGSMQDPLYGWQHYALGGVAVFEVPGNHVTLVDEPNAKTLALKIQACIDRILIEE
jgi:amino acid adenylation domain-containing protein